MYKYDNTNTTMLHTQHMHIHNTTYAIYKLLWHAQIHTTIYTYLQALLHLHQNKPISLYTLSLYIQYTCHIQIATTYICTTIFTIFLYNTCKYYIQLNAHCHNIMFLQTPMLFYIPVLTIYFKLHYQKYIHNTILLYL